MTPTLTVDETATRLILNGSRELLKWVTDHFKYRPPDYWRATSYQLYKRTFADPMGPRGWDGYLSPVRVVHAAQTWWELDRGHKDQLLQYCRDEGIDVTGKLLTSPFATLEIDDVPDDLLPGAPFKLDHQQKLCVCELLKHGMGTVQATVNAGKTAIFYACAALIKKTIPSARCLYIVPTERLVNQAAKDGRGFLPSWDISQFGGGKDDDNGKDVVVATTAKLYANFDELKHDGFFKSLMVLMSDEVHHASSKTNLKVIQAVPAFFRFGASDSVKDEHDRDVVKGTKIRGLFGPKRAQIEVHTLIDAGRSAKPLLYIVDVPEWDRKFDGLPHQVQPNTPAWANVDGTWQKVTYLGPAKKRDAQGEVQLDRHQEEIRELGWHEVQSGDTVLEVSSRDSLLYRAYDQGIIRFKPRNQLIVEWASYFSQQGWPTLVVATRTVHVRILESLLLKAGLNAKSLISDHSTKERDEVFAWLMESKGNVLVSPLVKEGVNLPDLRAGVVADVVADSELARQIIGRFIRKKEGDNSAHLVWFWDRQIPSSRAGGRKLFKELETIRGYSFHYPCLGPTCIGPLYQAASLD